MSILRRIKWYSLSSIGAPLMSLATLPLFTMKLGPEQFGSFAIGAALASVISAVAGSVSMVSLPAQLAQCNADERRSYITSVFVLALMVALGASVMVSSIFAFASASFGLSLLSFSAAVVSVVAGLLNSIWAVCVEILTIDGRAKRYALTTFAQVLSNIIAVSAALFYFDDIKNALFWGFLAASVVGFGSALLLFNQWVTLNLTRSWFTKAGSGGVASVIASLSENGKVAVERSYLGALVGVYPLGLYAHAQYYKGAAMATLNALSRGVLPTALKEAQVDAPHFPYTIRLWAFVQAFILSAALGFALVGREVIGLLTHGKFSDAAPLATALMLILLLQTAAKPHTMLLLSRGRGHITAHLNTFSIVISLILLFATAPWIGIWAAIVALTIQVLVHRLGVYFAANSLYRISFSDYWVVNGVIALGGCLLIVDLFNLGIVYRSAILFTCYAAMLWKMKSSFSLLMSARLQ